MAKAKAAAKDQVKPREIIGKTTSDIRDMQAEQAKGAVKADNEGAVRKEIFAPSKYYVVSIDRIAAMNVKFAFLNYPTIRNILMTLKNMNSLCWSIRPEKPQLNSRNVDQTFIQSQPEFSESPQ
jgi:hypothetical protein